MRTRLLTSVLFLCSTESARSPIYIDDVVRHANVARGTFYKYFDSLDEAVAEVAGDLGNVMLESVLPVYEHIDDPVHRVATGCQLFLIRAMLDPNWGAFILKMGLFKDGDLLPVKIQEDLALGVERGEFFLPSISVASDALMGINYEAIRHIINMPPDLEYIHSMASMALRSFGVPPTKADIVVRATVARLSVEAPGVIFWWRELPTASHCEKIVISNKSV